MEIERILQNIHLDEQELLVLIQKAFPKCQKFEEWQILSGGAFNTTYKFKIDRQFFVLRLFNRDRSFCKIEKAIHQYIEKKVPTPKLIYANECHEPWAYSIHEFVEGISISDVPTENQNALSYELGRVLASIHAFHFPEAGFFNDKLAIQRLFKKGSSPYFEEAFSVLSNGKNVRQRLGHKVADEMLEFMEKYRDFFPVVQDNVCLVHSDFKPVNLIYTKGKVVVLDWEFAHAGIGILDFSILLRHRQQFPLNLDFLVQGYTDFGGTLTEEWFRSALITDFVNSVALLDSPCEQPKLFHQLKNAIQNTMNHWNESK